MKVFVSYTTKDGQASFSLLKKVERLCLKSRFALFIDLLHNNDQNPQWRIERELADSDLFIIINSPSVFKSDWVKREIEIARKQQMPIHITSLDRPLQSIRKLLTSVC